MFFTEVGSETKFITSILVSYIAYKNRRQNLTLYIMCPQLLNVGHWWLINPEDNFPVP